MRFLEGKCISVSLTLLLLPYFYPFWSGSERSTPKHGYGGTRFYYRGAAGASGAVHESCAVLAEASRGEPPGRGNRSRAELDSKVNTYVIRGDVCHWVSRPHQPVCKATPPTQRMGVAPVKGAPVAIYVWTRQFRVFRVYPL